jgi:exopolysaccharide biosynthesis polyprenyl glycosylphosphotransferase
MYESVFFIRYYKKDYFSFELYPTLIFVFLSVVIALYFILIFQSNSLYKINVILIKSKHLTGIIKSFFYGIIGIIFISFITKFPLIDNSRILVLSFTVLSIVAFSLVRVILLRWFYLYLQNHKILEHNIVIWGAGKSGQLLAAKIQFENHYSLKILGFIDDNKAIGERVIDDLFVLGNAEELKILKNDKLVDEVIVAIDNIEYSRIFSILDYCNKIEMNVKLTSELFNDIHQLIETEVYSGIPIIDLSNKVNNNNIVINIIKKMTDIIGAMVGLILLSPLFVIISILIKNSSPGKIFYKQVRIGKNGKPFMFYKFRSMYLSKDGDRQRERVMIEFMKNGSNQNSEDTKIVNHERVTKIGRFIRKTSLDELPQLINVLKGDMSLVGPRPCLLYEYKHYDEWQKRRLSVLPGCTGVWQVSGRSKVSFRDSIVLDIYYVNNVSPWFDLQLILKTFPVMLFGRGGR